MPTDKLWKTISAEHVVNSKYLRVRKERVQLPTGEIYDDYFINESRGWATVFCRTCEGLVILNRQYKHGIGCEVIELPAGSLEAGESAIECARRELMEETGYSCSSLEPIASFALDPTSSEGWMHLFYGLGARQVAPVANDPREQVATILASTEDLMLLVRTRVVNVMGHVAAIYSALDYEGYLGGAASGSNEHRVAF